MMHASFEHSSTAFWVSGKRSQRCWFFDGSSTFGTRWHSELEQLVAEGDIVVERFTASGTHRGELMGAQPTGKTINLAGINIFRIDGDKIVERWGRLDELGLLRQLGLFPG
jgi:predicted ester cyclase